jgi:hypothetical protein
MQRVAEQLEPGMAAVVVLATADMQDTIDTTLKAHAGQLSTQDLGPDTSADLATLASEMPAATWAAHP